MNASLRQHGGQAPSVNVVLAVAEVSECNATDLPPLYETIDPDRLDEAVRFIPGLSVHFEYAGREVTVREAGVDVDGETNVAVDLEPTVDEEA